MPMATTPGSYEDIRLALDRALESPNGVRITAESPGAAVHLRQRFYTFRKMEQKRSKEIYPIGNPHHGTSAYDVLTFTIVERFIEVRRPPPLIIENL